MVADQKDVLQFNTGEWVQDTRQLSLAAKGAWIDLLCAMHRSQNRGAVAFTIAGCARLIGATAEQAAAVISELTNMRICNVVIGEAYKVGPGDAGSHPSAPLAVSETCKPGGVADGTLLESVSVSQLLNHNGVVTLSNRRMLREEKTKELSRIRLDKLREKRRGNVVAWPENDLWLKKFLEVQELLKLPEGIDLQDPQWWERISKVCNGLSVEFLEIEFAKMGNWCENPTKKPPAEKQRNGLPNIGGWKNFVGGWLERAYRNERRFGSQNQTTRKY